MNTSNVKLAPAADRAAAILDRMAQNNTQPTRGAQMAFAMVDAAIRSPEHPQSQNIGQSARNMR